jgi:S1-C subfamily serine protease
MKQKLVRFVLCFLTLLFSLKGPAGAGILKSLNQELTALAAGTEPYLVTVNGDDGLRNLVASGIVFLGDGYVITSSQLYGAKKFQVAFRDGRAFPAEKAGVDRFTGIAVLKMAASGFSTPKYEKAKKLTKGVWVAVIGNSYDIPGTISFGSFSGSTDDGLLKLSINASPGSTGGVVLDLDGNIVGILIAGDGGFSAEGWADDSTYYAGSPVLPGMKFIGRLGRQEGVCYAVPIKVAIDVARQIAVDGKIRRCFLGISARGLSPAMQSSLGIHGGIMVADIEKSSPADSAGIEKGDFILSVDDHDVASKSGLYSNIRSRKPGDIVRVQLLRNGRKLRVVARLTEAKEEYPASAPPTAITAVKASENGRESNDAGLIAEVSRLRSEVAQLRLEITRLREEAAK